MDDFAELLEEGCLEETISDESNPAPNGLPIYGLKTTSGMLCNVCQTYACTSLNTLEQHYSKEHNGVGFSKTSNPDRYYTAVKVQRLNTTTAFFVVQDVPSNNNSVFSQVFNDFIKEDIQVDMAPPLSTRDVTPSMRITGWAEYLGDFALNKDMRHSMLAMSKLPYPGQDKPLDKIQDLCLNYFEYARSNSKKTHEIVRKTLMGYPM